MAGLLGLLGGAAPASAQQSRWNLRLETGLLFNVGQPAISATDQRVHTVGGHFRLGVDYEPHERVSLAVLYGVELLGATRGGTDAQQTFAVGLRFRPWWNREGEFLLPPNPRRVYRFFTDVFSDVWIDAHIGASVAAKSRLYYDAALGMRLPLVSPIQISLYVRWQHAIGFGSDGSFLQITAGLELNAGFQPVHGAADSDGDGVPDSRDNCADTPRGRRVNQWGCPVGVDTSRDVFRCSDTDLDGVCDGVDDCPDSPYRKPVDVHGCPKG